MIELRVCNDLAERVISVTDGVLGTRSVVNLKTGKNYLRGESEEFRFKVEDEVLTAADFQYQGHQRRGDGLLTVVTVSRDGLEVRLTYEAVQGYAVLRKWMRIENKGAVGITVKDLEWERLSLAPGGEPDAVVWSNYFSTKGRSAKSVMDDCVIGVHSEGLGEGFIVGSEAFGVLKQMEVYEDGRTVAVGFNNCKETVFEKVLSPGEAFETPAAFLLLYQDNNFQRVVDTDYAGYVREKLIIMRPKRLPNVLYNTFNYGAEELLPYTREELRELIDVAADLGIDCFQVDAGWYDRMGDWNSNDEKFPQGFSEIAEAIKSRGMKLALWFSLAQVDVKSRVAMEHPDWIALDEHGEPVVFFAPHKGQRWVVMCMGSGYRDFVRERIDEVVKEYGVDMLKIDLQAIRNVYVSRFQHGCWAEGHRHRTHGESYWEINEAMLEVCDAWRERNPGCLIDLTYETAGVLYGIDLGEAKRLHLSWAVNYPGNEEGVRRVIYQRGRVVAPCFMNAWVIDTAVQRLNEYTLLSNMGTYPIVIGDLRKMSTEEKGILRKWLAWIREQRGRSDFYGHYRVCDVFPVPDAVEVPDLSQYVRGEKWMGLSPLLPVKPDGDREGAVTLEQSGPKPEDHPGRVWDGFSKQDGDGVGPVFFFRPLHSTEERRRFRIPWVRKDWRYRVTVAPGKEMYGEFTGEELIKRGVEVEIKERKGAKALVFEKA